MKSILILSRYAIIALCGHMLLPASAYAGTTRMDSEFFAFKPTPISGIKSQGAWVADRTALIGLKGNVFGLDVRAANWMPQACRQAFSSTQKKAGSGMAFSKMPVSTPGGQDGQALTFKSKDCEIRLWLSSPTSFGSLKRGALGKVRDPGTPFIVFGVMQVLAGGDTEIREFVVGADHV